MYFRALVPTTLLLLSSASVFGCGAPSEDDVASTGEAITSNEAKILDFEFEAEVIADSSVEVHKAVVSQLMYAQGILTAVGNGNGQVGNVKLARVTETASGGAKRIRYKASLPVAWPTDRPAPTSYELKLPLDATAFEAFNAKYDGRCGSNEHGKDSFWLDWNPKAERCTIDDSDISRSTATVGPHAKETKNKYPEYDLIWQDGRLDVVALFGIISSNTPGDYGYREARSFLDNSTRQLIGAAVQKNATSSSILADVTVTGKVTIGGRPRDVKVDVLVVPDLQSAGADFDTRYDALSEKADMILYNGHAGHGKNVNALAHKGKVAAGKYQLMLVNGCNTFAYIDTTLTDRRREANGAANDPDGTRYLDVVANALPNYVGNLASMSNDLFNAVVKADRPERYNELLSEMPKTSVVVVFGEEDNRFQP